MVKIKNLITVIVPIHNVERYLNKCIRSIVTQDYKNLEILLINNGSIDDSGKICDSWSKRDNRIKVIHCQMSDLSYARNIGLKEAHGTYLAFVDSDDFINQHYFTTLYDNLIYYHSDISIVGYYRDKRRLLRGTSCPLPRKLAIKYLHQDGRYTVGVWGKLFKKELFQNLSFPVGKINEDYIIMYNIFYRRIKQICYDNSELYYYRQNNLSITSKLVVNPYLVDSIIEFIKTINPTDHDLIPYISYDLIRIMVGQVNNIIISEKDKINNNTLKSYSFYIKNNYRNVVNKVSCKKIRVLQFMLISYYPKLYQKLIKVYKSNVIKD